MRWGWQTRQSFFLASIGKYLTLFEKIMHNLFSWKRMTPQTGHRVIPMRFDPSFLIKFYSTLSPVFKALKNHPRLKANGNGKCLLRRQQRTSDHKWKLRSTASWKSWTRICTVAGSRRLNEGFKLWMKSPAISGRGLYARISRHTVLRWILHKTNHSK